MSQGKLSLALTGLIVFGALLGGGRLLPAQKAEQPPHGQDSVPGPPLSPAEAIRKMRVPDGFSVELVAAEPDIVNPVAMTFDERGRIWITESLEYPRRDPGPGRDRVKVLESTRGDGRYDKITVFAEGLNIPSGIAVGHGGVWVANSPDILFYREGPDGRAAGKPEVVVTGFGRSDTHELPNSLTWGPDGWLYGLNGVFNHSHVKHHDKVFDFTCALFRIHPRTREFQLFAEGTSNPWGIAWDNEGSAFVSACVIDHLWHLAETGYYHRQGGPYPPFTWKIDSIVRHKHQKAAYCGLHFFDSDAYPPEFREKLYMGNIHGSCINCDELTRDGATYFAKPRPDFLTANDQWFMPVAQKTGPDGCLYILDWYDRYHCYQDANRDPRGIDRDRGRLYRVRYKNTPPAGLFDLSKESDDQLIERLHSPNVYFRDLAQRLLCERNSPAVRAKLEKLVLDDREPRKARMHGLWALIGTGTLDAGFHMKLLEHEDAGYRAWGVRAAGNMGKVSAGLREKVESLSRDPSPDVLLQVAVAARKVEGLHPEALLLHVLASCGDDRLIPHIVWQNLHPLLEGDGFEVVAAQLKRDSLPKDSNLARLMPRVFERLLAPRVDPRGAALLLQALLGNDEADPEVARQCLATLANKIQTGELAGDAPARWARRLRPALSGVLSGKPDQPLYWDAALLAATLADPAGLDIVRPYFLSDRHSEAIRLQALEALVAAKDAAALEGAGPMLTDAKAFSSPFRARVLGALSRLDDPRVAEVVLARYPNMEPDLQPKAVELLTQRTAWARQLLRAVAEKKVPAGALNVNHVRKLLANRDPDIVKQVKEQWGTLREDRNPEREKVVADMKKLLAQKKGDPKAGQIVFRNVCAQCHRIYGEGQDVGPDITSNGRNDYDQLLSNVFDPSLVIGAAYQATLISTTDGRVLTGLVVEDNAQRVVLKTQGGKQETVPRGEIDEMKVSKMSLMPEGLEKQMKEQEILDLFAFLTLDKPPGDPTAKKIPGAPK
jgi:putative membrane-bound dehydrogenase-like protein